MTTRSESSRTESRGNVKGGTRALLAQLIDYAGLFPPATLDMATTVANYADYLAGDDAWMLGRLIVPVSRLDEFEAAAGAMLPHDENADPWTISALTAPAGDRQLAADLHRIERFNEQHAQAGHGQAVIDAIELRASNAADIESALGIVPSGLVAFVEIPVADDPRGLIAALSGAEVGAKVRTGGLTAEAFPAAPDVARFLVACAAADVPVKATAGMHHPIRHRNDALGVEEFGFLNFFVAACLAEKVTHDELLIAQVLEDRTAGEFVFSDQGLTWRGQRVSTADIEDVRDFFAVSFGSCSFDEPRQELRRLRLL